MKKILYVGSECMPFSATGGLGDVMGSLPKAVKEYMGDNVDIRVVMPLYGSIGENWRKQMKFEKSFTVQLGWRNQYCGILSLSVNGVVCYFLDNEFYFKREGLYGHFDDGERFAFFSKAAVQMMEELDYFPDVLHANDWHSAMSVVYLKTIYKDIPRYSEVSTVFTIHNIEYQGKFGMQNVNDLFSLPWKYAELVEFDGAMNLMKAAIECADKVTTVSPRYAEEIRTPEYGCGLNAILEKNAHKLMGIINGIDIELYDPHTDECLEKKYMWRSISGKKIDKTALQRELGLPERDVPMFAMIGRLAHHKGLDLVRAVIHRLLANDVQFVVIGTGEAEYESFLTWTQEAYPDKMKALITYDRALSRRLYAASDFFVMPSKSEPCGLAQMIASRYGSVPVTRATGGLYDTIKDYRNEKGLISGNGLSFSEYSAKALYEKLSLATELYAEQAELRRLQQRVMKIDFSWAKSAEEYFDLYQVL